MTHLTERPQCVIWIEKHMRTCSPCERDKESCRSYVRKIYKYSKCYPSCSSSPLVSQWLLMALWQMRTAEGLKGERTCESDIKITTIDRFCLQLHVTWDLISARRHTHVKWVRGSHGAGRLLGSDVTCVQMHLHPGNNPSTRKHLTPTELSPPHPPCFYVPVQSHHCFSLGCLQTLSGSSRPFARPGQRQ